MIESELRTGKTARRDFLCAIAGGIAACASRIRAACAQDSFYVLKDGGVERLRLDFNANLEKVRLVAILSPT